MKKNVKKICNRIIVLFLFIFILSNSLSVSAANIENEEFGIYEDVKKSDWFYECVDFCAQKGIMIGMNEQCFAPERTITRAEFITALYRLAGKPEIETKNKFADVPEESYYANAVLWGYEAKVVFGTSETTFSPEQFITREEIACMLARYAQSIDAKFLNDGLIVELAILDENSVSDYAKESVSIMLHEGLMIGKQNGMFCPQDSAVRAEAAMVFMRLQKQLSRE